MKELLATTTTHEFEENGSLSIRSATWLADSLEMCIVVDHGDETTSEWVISCEHVLECLLTRSAGAVGLDYWVKEHPLLSQYSFSHDALYFSAAPPVPDQVVGELWFEHSRATDDWIPFDRYINRNLPLRALLESGSGLIARDRKSTRLNS